MIQLTHVTTRVVWMCTAILIVADTGLAILAWRIISRRQFQGMHRLLIIAGGSSFLLLWTSVMLWAWDWFYVYIFPTWARSALPPIFWVVYTLVAWAMVWMCLKLPGNPAINWSVLGGVEGLLSHLYAIYGLGAASKPPIMHGVDPLAVLMFAIFEKAFYWSLILLVCWLIYVNVLVKRRKNLVHAE